MNDRIARVKLEKHLWRALKLEADARGLSLEDLIEQVLALHKANSLGREMHDSKPPDFCRDD